MSTDAANSKGAFLKGLSSVVRGSGEQTGGATISKEGFQDSARELQAAIEALKSTISAQREEIAKQTLAKSAGFGGSKAASSSGPSSKELEQQELQESLNKMHSSIVELHSNLKTGISAATIDQATDSISEILGSCQGEELDARIRAAVVDRIYKELGPVTWKIALQLMEQAGVKWPEPGGLLPGISDDERARAVQYRMAEAENLFLSQPLKTGVESMQGIVTAWKRYPSSSSWLWQEAAIRGVAAGVRCQLLLKVVSKLKEEGEALRAKASELLAERMANIQKIMSAGVRSIEDAEKVVRGTDEVVKELLPDLAWQRAQQTVQDGANEYLRAK